MHQEVQDIEIIAVCNDHTPLEEFHPMKADFPTVLWLHEPIRGSAYARNTGWLHAKGEWIQFLDADDLLLPGKIKHQLPTDHAAVIVSPHLFRYTNGRTAASRWLPDDIWTGLLQSGLGSTSSMLFHKEALQRTGGWAASLQSHQEYELVSRMAMLGLPIVPIHLTETIVRQRAAGSITLDTSTVRPLEGIRLREHIWDYLVKNGLHTPERKDAFLQYLFRQLRGLYKTDAVLAQNIYNKYFSDTHFIPELVSIWGYKLLFRSFGFSGTEKLMHTYRMVRDKYLPFLPKNK